MDSPADSDPTVPTRPEWANMENLEVRVRRSLEVHYKRLADRSRRNDESASLKRIQNLQKRIKFVSRGTTDAVCCVCGGEIR